MFPLSLVFFSHLFTFLSQYRILHRFTYGLHARGPRCNIYKFSMFDLPASPNLIDLRWLAPRLVTLVNSMDSLCCLPFSLSLSLFLSHSHTFCHIKFALVFARGAIIIRVFDKSVAKVSRTSLILHAIHRRYRCFVFTSQRFTSHALFPENYISQINYVHGEV